METSRDEHRRARERLQLAFDLYEAGEQIMRQNLKRRHPGASQGEIEERLRQWMLERPGAEHGDAEGRPVRWPRKVR